MQHYLTHLLEMLQEAHVNRPASQLPFVVIKVYFCTGIIQ